jgi:hypothetical protein
METSVAEKKPRKPRKKKVPKAITDTKKLRELMYYPDSVKEALRPLSVQERKFVLAYVGEANGNGQLACKLAGIAVEGAYINRAARASQMMKRQAIRNAIDAWFQAYALTAVELTAQVADIANASMAPFTQVEADGSIVIKVSDDDTWAAYQHWIKEIECDPKTGRITRIVLHDAQGARRDMMKILKLTSDAPIFAMGLIAAQMTDADLLRALEEARAEEDKATRRPAITATATVSKEPKGESE